MAQILVRGIDDELMKAFKQRAKTQGKSVEQAVRELIENSARQHQRSGDVLERMTAFRERMLEKYGSSEIDVVDDLRADRESR